MNWRDGAKNLMFFTEMFWRRNIRSFEEHIGYYSTKFALILRHLSSGFIWSWKLFHVYWFTCILECCSQSSVSSSLPISPLITRHVEVIQSQFFFSSKSDTGRKCLHTVEMRPRPPSDLRLFTHSTRASFHRCKLSPASVCFCSLLCADIFLHCWICPVGFTVAPLHNCSERNTVVHCVEQLKCSANVWILALLLETSVGK